MSIIIILFLMGLITFGLLSFSIWKREIFSALATIVMLIITLVTWFSNSYTETPTGHGDVVMTFNKVELVEPVLTEGLNWIKPWQKVSHMSNQQVSFNRNTKEGTGALVQAKDNIPVMADVSFHSILNFSAMGYVRKHYGESYAASLLYTSAGSALRTAGGSFDSWDDLMVKERINFQNKITSSYQATVESKMRSKGIPEEIVISAFIFPTVDLRKVLPVDRELTEQIALTKAAAQKTERKKTEIINAGLEAQKRGQDGTAIRDTILRVLYKADDKGFLPEGATLPSNASLADISNFMLSIAAIKKADAVELSAESGNLNVMVTGGAIPALPAPVIK